MRLVTQTLGKHGIVPASCIDNLEGSLRSFVNMLHGPALHGAEGRAQRGVTFDERLKRTPQGNLIRFRFYPERRSDVISHAFRCELLEEPESLLSVRQRKRVRFLYERGWTNRRCGTRRFDQIETAHGHLSDALTADEFRHREEHAEMRLDAVGQLNSNQ